MILENGLVCCSYFFCNFVLSWDFFKAEIYGLMWSSIARTYIEYLVDGDRSVCEQAYPYKKLLNFAPWKATSLASISIVYKLKGAEQILIEIYLMLMLSRPRNFAKPGCFYHRNNIRFVIYMVKIDVKDWPDNVHGGEWDTACIRPWTWGRPH